MNTHVDYSAAKLLKEKGFDEICYISKWWDSKNNIVQIHHHFFVKNSTMVAPRNSVIANSKKGLVSAPTIAETIMWLYEKHGIWIEVRKHTRDMLLCFSPYIDNTPINSDVFFNDYDSPTEAYQEAINYTLKNLIK